MLILSNNFPHAIDGPADGFFGFNECIRIVITARNVLMKSLSMVTKRSLSVPCLDMSVPSTRVHRSTAIIQYSTRLLKSQVDGARFRDMHVLVTCSSNKYYVTRMASTNAQ